MGVLEAHIKFDPWTDPDALFPVRRLEGPLTWQLELWAARKYVDSLSHARVLIDEPRGFDKEAVLERLKQVIGDLMSRLERPGEDLPLHVLEAWRRTIKRWQLAFRDFDRATTTRHRAEALVGYAALPLEVLFGEIDILAEDLPIEWFGTSLGFLLERRGVLSVRESRLLHQSAEQLVEDWQEKRFPRRRLDRQAAQRVVGRLASLVRLLTGKSLLAYLAKVTRVAHDRHQR